ncbi:MAG: chromosomal replication initiator protein DnaA [Gammaproteobacteria bacterium]|nr:chromosomal replication initiator protein DnaA [Gammaproteobacteria bacterium]MBT5052338.1 chromosomal replication initiator protein DnaA [Gammaproteobacteria bacterium]MDC0464681.1 chromosomal replication initiator protein DnaA [Pseudomonadales bacterium]
MVSSIWQNCLSRLETELTAQQYNTWIKPLQLVGTSDDGVVYAPNKYILDTVESQFLVRIKAVLLESGMQTVALKIGSQRSENRSEQRPSSPKTGRQNSFSEREAFYPLLELNKSFTFDSFVGGRSNEMARAAAIQVSENVGGSSYNPLLLYGGVGLGKTHLMHAVGNAIADRHPELKVAYMYSQRFMEDMVRAIEHGAMSEFTQYYRSVDVLLMDDIQFLAKGSKSQEEFFHVFNRLQEDGRQIVLTCDRYPKEIQGLEERLESRFVWGMTAAVEPPELETRVAILLKKAEREAVYIPSDAAFFIAERVRSNVRELEGALRRVIANARFAGRPISIDQVKSALRDLIAIQARQVGIDNIQKTVADYYKLRMSDLLSKKRNRSLARPRQVAMALSKELTNHSLPEIGDAFGGRDHTTVLHACRKVEELREMNPEIKDDYRNLRRMLTS